MGQIQTGFVEAVGRFIPSIKQLVKKYIGFTIMLVNPRTVMQDSLQDVQNTCTEGIERCLLEIRFQ